MWRWNVLSVLCVNLFFLGTKVIRQPSDFYVKKKHSLALKNSCWSAVFVVNNQPPLPHTSFVLTLMPSATTGLLQSPASVSRAAFQNMHQTVSLTPGLTFPPTPPERTMTRWNTKGHVKRPGLGRGDASREGELCDFNLAEQWMGEWMNESRFFPQH